MLEHAAYKSKRAAGGKTPLSRPFLTWLLSATCLRQCQEKCWEFFARLLVDPEVEGVANAIIFMALVLFIALVIVRST